MSKTKFKFVKKDKIGKSKDKSKPKGKPNALGAVKAGSDMIKLERLVVAWAVDNPNNHGIAKFLKKKGYGEGDIITIFEKIPAEIWHIRANEIKDGYTRELVAKQMDFVSQMHDQLITTSKLGLSKAIEMMSKMKIESYKDDTGKMQFSRFKPNDLRQCMSTVFLAMKIMRTSFGLPSEEGAMQVWNQMNINMPGSIQVKPGEDEEEMAKNFEKVEELISYDDLRVLIEAERMNQAKLIEAKAKVAKVVEA